MRENTFSKSTNYKKTSENNKLNLSKETLESEEAKFLEMIGKCDDIESLDGLMDNQNFRIFLAKNKKMWSPFIDRMVKIMWRANMNRDEISILLNENYWLYNNLKEYEQLIICNLDLKNHENFLNTEMYLDFVDNLHLYSEEAWPAVSVAHAHFENITKALGESLASEDIGYFTSLRGDAVFEHLNTSEPTFFEFDEEEFREAHRMAEHEEKQAPFEIAPKIFALPTDEGFLVSEPRAYEELRKIVNDFNFHADREFVNEGYETESNDEYVQHNAILGISEDGNGSEDSFGSILNENEYYLAKKALEEVKFFTKKQLSLADLTIENQEKSEEAKIENAANFNDYRYLMTKRVRNLIEKEFGFLLNKLTFREQFYFLNHIKKITKKEAITTKNFFQKFGLNGAKAFLSLEVDNLNVDRILNIGDVLEKEDAQRVFQKIGGISDLAANESEDLRKLFFKHGYTNEMSNVQLELLRKTHEIIVDFSNEINKENINQKNIQQLLDDLDGSKTEVILLAAALKMSKKTGEKVDLEYVKNLNFAVKDFGTELSEEDKQEMLAVAERNWRQNENMKDAVTKGLEESLQDTHGQKFYVLKYQSKIVSFVRFEKTERGTLFAGSFNVDPEARGLGIGDEMMERALRTESENHVLEATVSPRIPAGTAYVERTGFIINGIIDNYHETGEPLFSIELDNDKNVTYQYRNEGKESEISQEDIKKQVWINENLDHIIGSEVIILKFDMKNDFEKMKAAMVKLLVAKNDNGEDLEDMVENKYLITRYFRDKDEQERDARYFVFEKLK